LDTEVSYAPGSPQYIFAQNDLAATTRTWKIVACHKPAYCSGGHGEDTGMKTMTANIFEPAGVDLVIAGHSHFYQHNLVHNVHHLVVGTSGAPLYVPTTASYTIRSIQDYNYAVLDATPTSLQATVYNSSDVVLDTVRFTKPSTNVVGQWEGVREYRLGQNYPNPFNPTTTIQYALTQKCSVTLTVFNTLGQPVATLVNGEMEAGYHEAKVDATRLASGVYFYRLQVRSLDPVSGGRGDFVQTRKLLLIR